MENLTEAVSPAAIRRALPTPQELRVAAAACNGAAAIRRTIGSFTLDDEPDHVSSEAGTLESVAAKLAALARALDVNR